jgi:alpha-mannosidase
MLYNYESRIVQAGQSRGHLKSNSSFISIEPDELVFSALKKSENGEGLILRIYNPTEKEISGKVRFGFNIKDIFLTNLEEKKVNKVPIINNNLLEVSLDRKKIKSYRIII